MGIALAAALFTGCTLIPEYTRPEAPVPADWPSGPAYKNNQSGRPGRIDPSAADIQWRRFFADERLQGIIGMALDNNCDLRVAVLKVERARVLYRVQRAELPPTVGGAFSGQKQRVPADLSGTGLSNQVRLYAVLGGGKE